MWRSLKPLIRDGIVGLAHRVGASDPKRVAGKLTVVTFHRVLPAALRNEYPVPELAVTPDELDWCLRFFAEHFDCQTVSDAYASLDDDADSPTRPQLAVTFDDGQLDNLEHALPILSRHGVPATFYVVAQAVGQQQPLWHDRVAYAWPAPGTNAHAKAMRIVDDIAPIPSDNRPPGSRLALDPLMVHLKQQPSAAAEAIADALADVLGGLVPEWDKLMDWHQIQTLASAGHEIGAHSSTHAILPNCDDAQLEVETAGAKSEIERHMAREVHSFCYPNGDHDDRVVASVRKAGYNNAVTTRFGVNPARSTPFRLFRCDIQSATSRDAWGRLSRPRLAWRIAAFPGTG